MPALSTYCNNPSANTAQEKGPVTKLEPRTYTLSRSFSHASYQSQSQILCLPLPYVSVVGVLLPLIFTDEYFANCRLEGYFAFLIS